QWGRISLTGTERFAPTKTLPQDHRPDLWALACDRSCQYGRMFAHGLVEAVLAVAVGLSRRQVCASRGEGRREAGVRRWHAWRLWQLHRGRRGRYIGTAPSADLGERWSFRSMS